MEFRTDFPLPTPACQKASQGSVASSWQRKDPNLSDEICKALHRKFIVAHVHDLVLYAHYLVFIQRQLSNFTGTNLGH